MTYLSKSKEQGKQQQQQQQQQSLLKKQSRERNRLHARQTRLRKKAKLEILREQVCELQSQGQELRQTLEDCRTAFILAGLSNSRTSSSSSSASGDTVVSFSSHIQSLLFGTDIPHMSLSVQPCDDNVEDDDDDDVDEQEDDDDDETSHGNSSQTNLCKRKKLSQPLTLVVHGGQTIEFGVGYCHLNWKTGAYYQNSTGTGRSYQLTKEQLETLRRQRNRLHAKTTRDRKKSLVSTMGQLVLELQAQKRQMLMVLVQVAQHSENFQLPLSSSSASSASSSSLLSTTRTTSGQEEDEKEHLTMVPANEICSVVSMQED